MLHNHLNFIYIHFFPFSALKNITTFIHYLLAILEFIHFDNIPTKHLGILFKQAGKKKLYGSTASNQQSNLNKMRLKNNIRKRIIIVFIYWVVIAFVFFAPLSCEFIINCCHLQSKKRYISSFTSPFCSKGVRRLL